MSTILRALTLSWIMILCSAAVAAETPVPDPPVTLVPGTAVQRAEYFRYRSLELEDAQGEELTASGRYWELTVPYEGEVEPIREHFRRLAAAGGEVLLVDGVRGLQFRLDGAEGPVLARLHVGGRSYTLRMVTPAPCPREVVFGNDAYAETKHTKGDINPPLVTDYPDSRSFAGQQHEFDRLELAFHQASKKQERTVEGEYWQKVVEVLPRSDGGIYNEEIREAYRLAALDAGAEILDTGDRSLVFRLPQPEAGDLWVHLWPQDGKYTLKVVQEAAMQQVLVLEKDEMLARLDALGKLTLRGIFFDTARATLQPASEPGLQSALDLLASYPDLVLEVGGHTDNVGQPADNQVLSENRAAAVRTWLVERGVAPERLEARGYGEERPVATNTTAVGRAANRRVELVKLAGGQARDLVTLVTPYPGSEPAGTEETMDQDTYTMYQADEGGRPREVEVAGLVVRRRFEVKDERGRIDTRLSGVQIRSNYRRAVLDLGGEVLAERTHGLYFRLQDAAGRETWFEIWAPGAKYSITAVKTGG